MTKTIRRVIAILLAATAVILLVLPAGSVSATYTKGDYVIDGGTLVSYTGSESDITIPLGISSIGKDCFSGNNNLVSVYIPDEVTSIDYAAFENCKNLRKVSIGTGLKSIGSSAFSGCQSLNEVNIPKYVENFGSGVFAACPNLSDVKIDDGNRNLICLDGVIYSRDGKKLYQYLAGRPYSTYEIPQPVKEIGEFGFYGANMLTTVTVAEGIEEIPEYAFLNCSALNKVNLPSTLKAIRKGAFGGCTNLTALTVPTTCGYIDKEAFTSLTGEKGDVVNETNGEVLSESNETVNNSNTNNNANEAGSAEVQENQEPADTGSESVQPEENEEQPANEQVDAGNEIGSTTVVGGEAVLLINPKSMHVRGFDLDDAQTEDSIAGSGNTSAVGEDFRNYSGREFDVISGVLGHYAGNSEHVSVPSDVNKIGNRVFYKNKNIKSVDMPSSVNEIGDFAFARSNLESVVIPDGTEKIGYAAFYNCSNLNSISVPSSVKTFELGALDGTGFINNWYQIEDGNNYLILGDGVLVAYKGIKSDVIIPDSVKKIGPGVFEGNTRIKSVVIPDAVTSIGEDAFNGCTSLSSVVLPSNLTSIEDRAFKDTNIKFVEIPASVSEIGLGAFDTQNVNGGLDSVIFKGRNLPDVSYKSTSGRLSASDLRTNAFNGCRYAFVNAECDLNSGTIFDPHSYGFRGQVYSGAAQTEDGSDLIQLRKCTIEPDSNGNVDVDSSVTLGNRLYSLSGVSDTAFNEYKNSDWCRNKPMNISLNGNNSDALNSLLNDVNSSYGSAKGSNSSENGINIFDNGLSTNAVKVSAVIPQNGDDFNLYLNRDESLRGLFNSAIDNRYGNHDNVYMDTYSIDMTDRLGTIPIHKMAKSKLEISMPLPERFNSYENVKMVSLDDNGLLEEVPCFVNEIDENNKSITFVASHLSPYAIVVLSDSEGLTVVTESVSVSSGQIVEMEESLAAPDNNNIVFGTLSKEVAGIPARFIIAFILFAGSGVLLILNRRKKAPVKAKK